MTLGGSWSATGMLAATNHGTVTLAGTFVASDFGTLNLAGGSVTVSGTINNSGNTLALNNSTTGSWTLDGGTISGGTISLSGASLLISSNRNNVLDGVTISGNLSLDAARAFLGIKDGLTLNGTLTLSRDTATLDLENTGTLGGTGTILSQGTNGSPRNIGIESGAAVTLESGLTIHGHNLQIGNQQFSGTSARSLVNNGVIAADVPGGYVIITGGNLTFTNNGTEQTIGNAVLQVGTATIGGVPNSPLTIQGVETALSATQFAFTWNGMANVTPGATYTISESADGVHFTTVASSVSISSPQVVGGLAPSTAYYVDAEVDNPGGSKVLYQSTTVPTQSHDASGFYKVTNVTSTATRSPAGAGR